MHVSRALPFSSPRTKIISKSGKVPVAQHADKIADKRERPCKQTSSSSMSVAPGPVVGNPVEIGEPVSIGEPTPYCTTSVQGQFADTPNLCAGPLTGPAPLLLAREVEGVYYHAEAGQALSIVICTSCGCSDCYCGCCFFVRQLSPNPATLGAPS